MESTETIHRGVLSADFALKAVVSPFEFDVMICQVRFKPSEIAVLTDSSLPNVSNARKRMHEN